MLSDVKQILLRAQQFDDNLIDTTISNINMDTLDQRLEFTQLIQISTWIH